MHPFQTLTWANRIFYAAVITGGMLLLWLLPPMGDWFRAFVKLEAMRLPYTVGFFSILFIVLLIGADWITHHSSAYALIVGACLGQTIGFISIFSANLFIQNGINRTMSTLGREGIFSVLITDFVVALLLWGWLLGAMALFILRALANRENIEASL